MAIDPVSEVTGTVPTDEPEAGYALPASLAENDIVLVVISSDNGWSGDAVDPNWPRIKDEGGDPFPGFVAAYKRMGATPDSEVLLTGSGAGGGTVAAYVIQAWRGVDPDTALDVIVPATVTGSSNAPDPPAITPVTNGARVFAVGLLDDDDTTMTAPDGFDNLVQENTGQGLINGGTTVAMASKEVAVAGEENPGVFTAGSSDAWKAITFALRPASGGAGGGGSLAGTASLWRNMLASRAPGLEAAAILADLRGVPRSSTPVSLELTLWQILAELQGVERSGAPPSKEATLSHILAHVQGRPAPRGFGSFERLLRMLADELA